MTGLCVFTYGGDEGDRTPGLGIANAALSQLSYIPKILFTGPLGLRAEDRLPTACLSENVAIKAGG